MRSFFPLSIKRCCVFDRHTDGHANYRARILCKEFAMIAKKVVKRNMTKSTCLQLLLGRGVPVLKARCRWGWGRSPPMIIIKNNYNYEHIMYYISGWGCAPPGKHLYSIFRCDSILTPRIRYSYCSCCYSVTEKSGLTHYPLLLRSWIAANTLSKGWIVC